MLEEYINKIIEIGKKETCTPEEYAYFSSNLPWYANYELWDTLRRDYRIDNGRTTRREFFSNDQRADKLSQLNDREERVSFLVDFAKGCHLIEKGHGGFGSTTYVFNLFSSLFKMDKDRAVDLYNWIAFHGGNYYIFENATFDQRIRDEQAAAKRREEILLDDQKIHLEAVARRKIIQDLHSKRTDETNQLYQECRERLRKMNDGQLIDLFNNDVGNPGWVSARARFHAAIYEEFKERGFDISAIYSKGGLSFAKKIELVGKMVVVKK